MDPTSRTFFTSQLRGKCLGLNADKPILLGTCQSEGGQLPYLVYRGVFFLFWLIIMLISWSGMNGKYFLFLTHWSEGGQLPYLVYRGVFFLFWLIIMLISWSGMNGKYFLFLTHWGLLFLCASTALQLAAAIYVFIKQRRDTIADLEKNTPILHRINWVIYNLGSVLAVIITLVYYSAIGAELKFFDICEHALTTLYVLADGMITGIPVRILHCWHTMLFFLCYVFATIFYWGATGKGLYEILDYEENPDVSAMTIILVTVVAVPLVQILLFLWHWLRVYLWQRLCLATEESNEEFTDSATRTILRFLLHFLCVYPWQRQCLATEDNNEKFSDSATRTVEPWRQTRDKQNADDGSGQPNPTSSNEQNQEIVSNMQRSVGNDYGSSIATENAQQSRYRLDSEPHYDVPNPHANTGSRADTSSRENISSPEKINPRDTVNRRENTSRENANLNQSTDSSRNSYIANIGRQMYGEQAMANPLYSVPDPRHSQSIPSASVSVYANVNQSGFDNSAFNDTMV